jgi:hypothetical protein
VTRPAICFQRRSTPPAVAESVKNCPVTRLRLCCVPPAPCSDTRVGTFGGQASVAKFGSGSFALRSTVGRTFEGLKDV